MREKEIDGKIYYEFEEHELDAKKRFLQTMETEAATEELMEAFFRVSAKISWERKQAWESVKKLLPPDFQQNIAYNHVLGVFQKQE